MFFFLSVGCFAECMSIFNVVNQHDSILLEQCWEWYLYGNAISFMAIFILILGVDVSVVVLAMKHHAEFDDSTMQKIIEASDRHQSHVELVLEVFQDDLPEQLRHLRPRESYTDEGYDSLRESCEPDTEMTQRELRIGETGPPSDAKPSQSAWSQVAVAQYFPCRLAVCWWKIWLYMQQPSGKRWTLLVRWFRIQA